MAVGYADIITDFIMAEHGDPSDCADPRWEAISVEFFHTTEVEDFLLHNFC